MSTNWANKQKAAVGTVPTRRANTKDRGERHEGVLQSLEAITFKTGSSGFTASYAIAGFKFPIKENIVLTKADGTATQFGESTLKRRLQAAGLSADEINTATDEQLSKLVRGAGVAVYLRNEEYMGKSKKSVASVFPLDDSGNGNAA